MLGGVASVKLKREPDDISSGPFSHFKLKFGYLFLPGALQLLPWQGEAGVAGETIVVVTGAPVATTF